jgi:type I restriction enzyme M protein
MPRPSKRDEILRVAGDLFMAHGYRRVSIDQIRAGGYNLDLKNPNKPDEGHGDIDHLLPEYERLLAQIAETRSLLKQELHHALTASTGTVE